MVKNNQWLKEEMARTKSVTFDYLPVYNCPIFFGYRITKRGLEDLILQSTSKTHRRLDTIITRIQRTMTDEAADEGILICSLPAGSLAAVVFPLCNSTGTSHALQNILFEDVAGITLTLENSGRIKITSLSTFLERIYQSEITLS